MSFIKEHKNISLSIGAYILAALIFILWTYIVPTSPDSPNWIGLGLFVILIITGIFFGFKSNKSRESSWAGNVLMLIGTLILLLPLYGVQLAMLLDSIFIK